MWYCHCGERFLTIWRSVLFSSQGSSSPICVLPVRWRGRHHDSSKQWEPLSQWSTVLHLLGHESTTVRTSNLLLLVINIIIMITAAALALQPLVDFLQLALSSTLPLQPVTPIITLSNRLICGRPFLLLESNLFFNILLVIHFSGILSTCPSHLILCACMNLMLSCPSIS